MRANQPGNKAALALRQPAKTGINQITPHVNISDYAGREAMVAAFGEQLVGFKDAEITTAFNYFINPERVKTSNSSGDFSAVVDTSRLKLSAGEVAAVGAGIAESIPDIIYRAGYDSYIMLTLAFDPPATGTTQEFGPHDELNGYSISLEQDNTISINHFRGGSLLKNYPQDEFILDNLDGDGLSKYVLDPQRMNIWRINYGYLGVLPPSFEIHGGPNIGWIPFHYIETTDSRLIVEDPYLPLRLHVTSDGTNPISMYSGSWNGGTIGPRRNKWLNDQFTADHSIAAFTGTLGTNIPVFTIRNDTTFKTKVNKIPIDIDNFTAVVDGNKTHVLRLIKNGALTAPTFNQVDINSVVSADTVASAITGGKLMRSYPLGKVDSLGAGVTFEEGEVRLFPGDTLTFAIDSGTVTSDIAGSAHWDELK